MHAERWDYIIVGGGSAGCVVAARLSERSSLKVLLLDAGRESRSLLITVPGAMKVIIGHPRFDWRYRSAPDASRNGRPIQWAGGAVLGGGSAINGLVFNRGLPRDYRTWVEMGGAGWGPDEVEPHFRSLEAWRGPPNATRGTHGPLGVETNRFRFELVEPFLRACEQVGLPIVEDINALPEEGVGATQANTRRGRRQSTHSAFLRPAMTRPNLTVRTGARVTRLVLEGGRCTGVCYTYRGRSVSAAVRREVVLCAGAVVTPKLMMLSGLGPPEELAVHGIAVARELPGVGRNLQDHGGALVTTVSSVPTISAMEMKPWRLALHGLRWLLRGDGPAAGAAVLATGMVRSTPQEAEADLFLQFTALSLAGNAKPGELSRQGGFTTICSVARPRTRGVIHLTSADPDAPLRIEHQQLGHPDDLRRLQAGLRLVRRIHEAPALAAFAIRERLPGPNVNSDQELEAYCRAIVGTQYHLSGTCRMGSDAAAVVDSRLRVHGIAGLRIADASIIPRITSANLNAPVMMIAEKAAAMIKEEIDPT